MNDENFETIIPRIEGLRPAIPQNAYRPAKRCPNCKSVYLTDTHCEACGRSLLYHPIGEPFGPKSLYGMKERYYENLPWAVKYFPLFESLSSAEARSYFRQLSKRFDNLLTAFGSSESISNEERRLFYVEMMELIDELLRYGENPSILQHKIENNVLDIGSMLTSELLLYIGESRLTNKPKEAWSVIVMNHRWFGLRVEYLIKVTFMMATLVAVAIAYYDVISSQFGK